MTHRARGGRADDASPRPCGGSSRDGDEFLLFQNEATEALNVLYRRKDGDYGLIEPEVA